MHPQMTRQQVRQHFNRQRGSAMLLTVLGVAIIGIVVGVMLRMVSHMEHDTANKHAQEESYHAGMAGINVAKAWIMSNAMCSANVRGNGLGTTLQEITSGALAVSNYVRAHDSDPATLNGLSNSSILGLTYTGVNGEVLQSYNQLGITGSGTTSDGRQILWEYSNDGSAKLVALQNDIRTTPSGTIFLTDPRNTRSYVSRMRITLPYRNFTAGSKTYTADDLRKVSLIVEAEGVTFSPGLTKKRMLQQKLLVMPGTDTPNTNVQSPPLSALAAIIAGGFVTASDTNSSLNVHWAPVLAKGNISLLGLGNNSSNGNNKGWDPANKRLTVDKNKYYGAGVTWAVLPGQNAIDKWVRWETAAQLQDEGGHGIFYYTTGNGNNAVNTYDYLSNGGAKVTDFFAQVQNGSFGASYNNTQVTLSGFDTTPVDYNSWSNAPNVFYDTVPNSTTPVVGSGELVQYTPSVGTTVDTLLNNTMNYTTWKNYAISQSMYLRPNNSRTGYVNNVGLPLYVRNGLPTTEATTNGVANPALTSLTQISMVGLVTNGMDTESLPDRVLFIDTPEGTANGTMVDYNFNSSDKFFWKGLLYANCNINLQGNGQMGDIQLLNPDQYNYRHGIGPAQSPAYYSGSRCFIDGILFAAGNIGRTGSPVVYGSVITKGNYTGTGSIDIYYNSRLKNGLFQNSNPNGGYTGSLVLASTVDGPIVELDAWP